MKKKFLNNTTHTFKEVEWKTIVELAEEERFFTKEEWKKIANFTGDEKPLDKNQLDSLLMSVESKFFTDRHISVVYLNKKTKKVAVYQGFFEEIVYKEKDSSWISLLINEGHWVNPSFDSTNYVILKIFGNDKHALYQHPKI